MMDKRNTTITGQGMGIGGVVDSFFYSSVAVPESIKGKIFSIEVCIENVFEMKSNDRGTFGLMVRSNLNPGSSHFSVVLDSTGVRIQFREQDNSVTTISDPTSIVDGENAEGSWLRVYRVGSEFQAFFRKKDTNYQLIGSATVNIPGSVEVGIALSSGKLDASERVTFSNFNLEVCMCFVWLVYSLKLVNALVLTCME